jgi:hypothetical protein
MTNNVVPISQAKVPAGMRARVDAGKTTNTNFSGGIRDAFPLLSIKGKVFRMRKDGQEVPIIDPHTRQVIPFLDVIMVNAAPTLSKSFYLKGFDDDVLNPPDCWSLDAVKPDPSVINKINPTCANCPKNIFGSAMAQDGQARGGKACSDAKRIAVIMPGHLGSENPLIFMLRVPATSLKNLKAYSDLLARQGWEPAACVTRLQFDYQQAYPKLEFHFVDSLNDAEYDEVVGHADSPYVASMLAAPDFDAGHTAPQPNPATQARVRQEAPILDDTQTVTTGEPADIPPRQTPRQQATQQKAAPVQQKAEPVQQQGMHALDGELIELPDGKWFNPKTGEYVEPPVQHEEQVPQTDPDTIALPGGKFFNKTLNKFVTGPEIGASPVGDEPKKKAAPKKKPPVQAAAEQQPVEAQQVQEDKPAGNGNGSVKPASADLEAMLKDLIPTRKA